MKALSFVATAGEPRIVMHVPRGLVSKAEAAIASGDPRRCDAAIIAIIGPLGEIQGAAANEFRAMAQSIRKGGNAPVAHLERLVAELRKEVKHG